MAQNQCICKECLENLSKLESNKTEICMANYTNPSKNNGAINFLHGEDQEQQLKIKMWSELSPPKITSSAYVTVRASNHLEQTKKLLNE